MQLHRLHVIDDYNYTSVKTSNMDYRLITHKSPIIIAHRGASRVAPENTLPAIEAAGKMGYLSVELDICSSSDGVLYLLHDGTLGRMTNGKGKITKIASSQIDKLTIRNNPKYIYTRNMHNIKVPRFEDALKECSEYHLVPIFEIKLLSNREKDMNTFLGIIKKHHYEDKLIVHSTINFPALEYLRSKDSHIIIMPTINNCNDPVHGYAFTKSFGYTALDCKFSGLTKNDVEKAHHDGLKVFCWTIDKPSDLKKAYDMGVDYVYSDDFPPNIFDDIHSHYNRH